MKKLIFPALCLSLMLTAVNVKAVNGVKSPGVSSVLNDDERKAVKAEELPKAVTKTIAGDAYKGWTIKEAVLVHPTGTVPGDATKKLDPYYEVTLKNNKETKTVKFHSDGSVMK